MSHILVVDDEQSMREMLGIMLRKEGYDVTVAGSRAILLTGHLGDGSEPR